LPFRKIPAAVWIVAPLAYLVYLFQLTAVGILGKDEPRYAAIGLEMARSGDWITPRLWGVPWFEKPALLYWMTAAAFRAGLGPELAPRLPVALSAIAFLVFYWWILRREFGCRAAWFATLILGTSGLWVGFSQSGVTDIPMTVCFSAAMLLALPWVEKRETRMLPLASALFGLAVLAKGLGPVVLALPLIRGRYLIDWLKPRVFAPFFAIVLPWYLLCYWRNGWPFIHDFFVVHTFGRFASEALAHGQPLWYYLPVLMAAMLPWTPLLGLLAARRNYGDARRQFLLGWFLFTLVFFSIMLNKLPGYILPAIPAAAALAGIALEEAKRARGWLAACALLLVVFPIVAQILPVALLSGLSRAPRPAFHPLWLAPAGVAVLAWVLESGGKRLAAVLTVAAGAALGITGLKASVLPELDRLASARGLWLQIGDRAGDVCLGNIKRDWVYGLNYYAGRALPACTDQEKPLQVASAPGDRVTVVQQHQQ
jgi:4-amino-4-deoxy-L-arabinose transferase-like glycosyltransferase